MKFGKATVSRIIDRCDETFGHMVELGSITPEEKEKIMDVVKSGIQLRETLHIGLVISALLSQMDLGTLRDLRESFEMISEKVVLAQTMSYLADEETTI